MKYYIYNADINRIYTVSASSILQAIRKYIVWEMRRSGPEDLAPILAELKTEEDAFQYLSDTSSFIVDDTQVERIQDKDLGDDFYAAIARLTKG